MPAPSTLSVAPLLSGHLKRPKRHELVVEGLDRKDTINDAPAMNAILAETGGQPVAVGDVGDMVFALSLFRIAPIHSENRGTGIWPLTQKERSAIERLFENVLWLHPPTPRVPLTRELVGMTASPDVVRTTFRKILFECCGS